MGDDIWRRFVDMLAVEREHSAVSGETARKIREVVEATMLAAEQLAPLEGGGVPEIIVAAAVTRNLTPAQLEEIVTDWLRSQVAI